MAEAFKCDKCGEYISGKPVTEVRGREITFGLTTAWGRHVSMAARHSRLPGGQAELCLGCVKTEVASAQ